MMKLWRELLVRFIVMISLMGVSSWFIENFMGFMGCWVLLGGLGIFGWEVRWVSSWYLCRRCRWLVICMRNGKSFMVWWLNSGCALRVLMFGEFCILLFRNGCGVFFFGEWFFRICCGFVEWCDYWDFGCDFLVGVG